MDCCRRSQKRVIPDNVTSILNGTLPPHWSRVNGWSKPFSLYQVVPWAMFLIFVLGTFCVFIPMLPPQWQDITYAVTGGIFVFHFIIYIITMSIDPAEASVRIKVKGSPWPPFDHSQQGCNNMEHRYCHLCGTEVNVKAKHCDACNKCVSGFDHHCLWMNNCVGSRNYWWFFSSVVSAFAGVLCVIVIVMYIFIQHWVNPEGLRMDPHYEAIWSQGTWLLFLPFFPVRAKTPVVLSIETFVLLLAAIILVLLGDLLSFHIYQLYNGLSTLDYLRGGKQETSKAAALMKTLPFVKQADNPSSSVPRQPRPNCNTEVHPAKAVSLTDIYDDHDTSAFGMMPKAFTPQSRCPSLTAITVIGPESVPSKNEVHADHSGTALGMKPKALKPQLRSRSFDSIFIKPENISTMEPANLRTRSAPEMAAWQQPEWAIPAAPGSPRGAPGGPECDGQRFITSEQLEELKAILKVGKPRQQPKPISECWAAISSQAGQGQTRTPESPIHSVEFSPVFRLSDDP